MSGVSRLAITLSNLAIADLDEIWDYQAGYSPETADKVLDALRDSIKRLAELPELGRARPELLPAIRQLNSNQYAIFYRVDSVSNQIDIIRILHGSRDFKRHL